MNASKSSSTSRMTRQLAPLSFATLFTAAADSHAQVVYENTPITVGDGTINYAIWDIDGDGTIEAWIGSSSTASPGYIFIGPYNSAWSIDVESQAVFGNLLPPGVSSFPFYPHTLNAVINGSVSGGDLSMVSGQSRYIGFLFETNGITQYGWAHVTATDGVQGTFTINEWAYELQDGVAITIGDTGSAVPEPAAATTGLGLLALGAAGLRRQRWLKRKAA